MNQLKRSITFNISERDDGRLIRNFLRSNGCSSATLTKLKRFDDGIMLNGKKAYVTVVLKAGDELTINLDDKGSQIQPENLHISVLYEDDDYIIYNKPDNIVVHPTKKYQSGTLGNDFMFRFGSSAVFRPIFRIDRNTTGLVAVAKNRVSSVTEMSKQYICICHGVLPESGTFDQPIKLCEGSFIKRTLGADGQPSVTHFKRICCNGSVSIALVTIETGRTHQIRVHFSGNGYPLVGDTLYGTADDIIKRQALHCAHIEFNHAVNGKNISVNSPLPSDFEQYLSRHNLIIL